MIEFIAGQFGSPSFVMEVSCGVKTAEDRFKRANEIDGDLDEEKRADLDNEISKHNKCMEDFNVWCE
jgi:hypothetical protein